MATSIERQRKEYDPNDPLTDEQKQMEEGDRIVITVAIATSAGAIIVLVL